MFKAFGLLFCVAVSTASILGVPQINSGSTNSALNVMSSGSTVNQQDVQNVNSLGGGYLGGYPRYSHHGIYPGHHYGVDPLYYGGHPGYLPGYIPSVLPPSAHLGYPGWGGNINSQSTNTASNILSTDSNVNQNNVQNVDNLRY